MPFNSKQHAPLQVIAPKKNSSGHTLCIGFHYFIYHIGDEDKAGHRLSYLHLLMASGIPTNDSHRGVCGIGTTEFKVRWIVVSYLTLDGDGLVV